MLRRLAWTLLASTLFSGFSATAAISADDEDFADFPDVPDVQRFDDAFRDAGLYVGVRGGAIWANETRFTINAGTPVENAYELGLGGSGFFGVDLPDIYYGLGVRLEGELGLSQFDIDTHNVGGAAVTAANAFGSTDAFTGMVNLYFDYGLGVMRPFVGGGIGVARVGFDDHGVTGAPGVMDDTENGLAWQVMVGLGVDVTSAVTIEAMVRYQGIEDVGLVSATGPKTQVDLGASQVMLGARFNF